MHPRPLIPAVLALVVLAPAPRLRAAPLRVRGRTQIESRVTVDESGVKLVGSLRDDGGKSLDQAPISITGEPVTVLADAEACAEMPRVTRSTAAVSTTTTALGSFCVALPHSTSASALVVSFAGSPYYAGTEVRSSLDSRKARLRLAWDPTPRYLSLDRHLHSILVRAEVEPEASWAGPLRLELTFAREGEAAPPLVRQQEEVQAGVARFELSSENLGKPGPGVLAVGFPGSDTVHDARASVVVETTARVALGLSAEVAPADPRSGLEIEVAVGSKAGSVPSGTVEALLHGQSVGAGRVTAGAATVLATFDPGGTRSTSLTLRYVPDTPWWLPGEALKVPVPLRPPAPWRRWPWAIAALLIALWVMRGWLRPARKGRSLPEGSSQQPSGRAALELVTPGPPRSGWRGVVLDAHDAAPVGGANLELIVPTFSGTGVAQATTTGEDGTFALPHVSITVEAAHMRITAPWHSELVRPLPPAGQVIVSLVHRRRALLERLVDWARRRGRPWAERMDPTPGHVAAIARSAEAEGVARWASAVETAAYGPDPVDARKEHEVQAQEPRADFRGDPPDLG